jgi:SAM-dependent methyltransferase
VAHPEQLDYVRSVREVFPQHFREVSVLEVGSRNVNGTVRIYFDGCDYYGIDCLPGELVEEVCLAREFSPHRTFDTVICTEMLEHDPHTAESLLNVVGRLLRPGGLIVITAAGPARGEHGTTKTDGEQFGPDPEYYRSVTVDDLHDHLDPWCLFVSVRYGNSGKDVYACGIRNQRKAQPR